MTAFLTTRRRQGPRRMPGPVSAGLCVLVVAWSLSTPAGATDEGALPPSLFLGPDAAVERAQMPAVDTAALMLEDAALEASGRAVRPRFAASIRQAIRPESSGTWESMADGSELWRLRISSAGATSLNLGMTRFDLPPGAALWVHDADGAQVYGPYTAADQNAAGGLWTPVIMGDELEVEILAPPNSRQRIGLEIGFVNHGYRAFGEPAGTPDPKQGACNIDVICPEGDPWRRQIRSVARISILGIYWCTAELVNNTAEDDRPYLLTAQHCVETAGEAPSLVAYWNYESPQCGWLAGGSPLDNQSGATFVASWPWQTGSDFTLLELDEVPDPDFNVYYAGWDATGDIPQGVVGIHHPAADEKAISFDDDPLTRDNFYGHGSHQWRVGAWELGTTEGGSSGSCIFDVDSGLCVGTLTTGSASCFNPNGYDIYGRFDVHWTGGGTPTTRLSDWLDPLDSGTLAIEGKEPTGGGGGGGANRLWLIPAAASTPGAEGSDWKSEITVVNPSSQTVTARINYVAQGVSWPGVPLLDGPIAIPRGTTRYLDDPLEELRPTVGMIYVLVDSDDALVSSRTYNQTADQETYGQGIPGVAVTVGQAAGEFILPLIHHASGAFRTNVGIVQSSAGELTVQISAFDADGGFLGSGNFTSSSGFRQINNIFRELGIDYKEVEGGWLRVQLVGPAPNFWTCYASVVDSRTNDPTYVLPVEP